MKENIKKFFQNSYNQALLNNNDFLQLYKKFRAEISNIDVRELTHLLYDSGIDVLSYVDEIPDCFLYGALTESGKYDSVITGEDFYVKEGVTKICYAAFKHCHKIKRFHLPSTLKNIEEYGLYALRVEEIYYNGTKVDWMKKVDREAMWTNMDKVKRLIFTDSEVIL